MEWVEWQFSEPRTAMDTQKKTIQLKQKIYEESSVTNLMGKSVGTVTKRSAPSQA
jgi:hypothetical protein